MKTHSIEDESDLQGAFWKDHPQFIEIPGLKQNKYPADIRIAWCDYVDYMQKNGEISDDLAQTATL